MKKGAAVMIPVFAVMIAGRAKTAVVKAPSSLTTVKTEIPSKRTLFSSTLSLGSNKFETVASNAPVNVLKNAALVPVDKTFSVSSGVDADTGRTYAVKNNAAANDTEVTLAFSPVLLKIKYGPSKSVVTMAPGPGSAAAPTFTVSGDTVTIKDLWLGVDLIVRMTAGGVKLDHIVTSSKGQMVVSYAVTGDAAKFSMRNKPWYWTPGVPVMNLVPTSFDGVTLSYDFSAVPVGTDVDPTITAQPASLNFSCWVRNNAVGPDYETIRSSTVGTDIENPGNGALQAITLALGGVHYIIDRHGMLFDTSAIPAGSVINSATLALYPYSSQSPQLAGDTVNVVTRATVPSSVNDFNIALWGAVAAGTFPETPATGYNTVALDTSTITIVSGGNTVLGFRSGRDLNDQAPLSQNYTLWNDWNADPALTAVLTVDYTAPNLNVTMNGNLIFKNAVVK